MLPYELSNIDTYYDNIVILMECKDNRKKYRQNNEQFLPEISHSHYELVATASS